VVVDARSEEEFREGHIPKSINIPPEKFGMIASLLPKDKKALIVFYCRGVG
jgi:rhodanese-related sulfurtransferase